MKSVKEKSQALRHYLESRITAGEYPPGTPLPPQRSLSELFDLARGSVGRILKELETAGLVEMRHGSGVYVCPRKSPKGRRRIALISEYRQRGNHYTMHIINGIQQFAAQNDCRLQWDNVFYRDCTPEILHECAEGCDGMIIAGTYDLYLKEIPTHLPVVCVNMHRDYGSASIVDMDPIATARLAADFFLRRNLRRAYLMTYPRDGHFQETIFSFRSAMFSHYWHDKGELIAIEGADEEAVDDITDFFDPEAGYLWVGGTRAQKAIDRYREKTGRELPDDICMLSIDGKNLLFPEYSAVNTIGTDYQQMGEIALEECCRRIDEPGNGPRRIYSKVFLNEIDKIIINEKITGGPK